MILLSAACTGCLSGYWHWGWLLAAFAVGSWFGLIIMGLLRGAKDRTRRP